MHNLKIIKHCSMLTTIPMMAVLLIAVLMLTACNSEQAYILQPQRWNDIEVVVEIRPGAPTVGMNEFIVIATEAHRKPAHAYIVSIGIKGIEKSWRQSIQDGHSGVYRRALRVNKPMSDVLLVKLESKDKSGILDFPLQKTVKNVGD